MQLQLLHVEKLVSVESNASEFPEDRLDVPVTGATFSLTTLLTLVTGIAIFLGVFRWNAAIALFATLLITPAIVRTIIVADRFRRAGRQFGWKTRLHSLIVSLGIVIVTLAIGSVAFIFVSVLFGLLGLLFGMAIGIEGMAWDTAIVGTAGGMIWGLGGAMLAIGYFVWQHWIPAHLSE